MKTRLAPIALLLVLSACGGGKEEQAPTKPSSKMTAEERRIATEEAIRTASTPFTIDGNDTSMGTRERDPQPDQPDEQAVPPGLEGSVLVNVE